MTTSRPSTCSFMGCLMLLMLLTACYGPQRQQMLALLDEADSLNRAYAKLPSDTLLRQAADFFDRHGTPNEQLRAHYLLGCAYRDMGEAPHALQCYLDAVDRADTLGKECNYTQLCRVYAQMAGIYYDQNLMELSLRALDSSVYFAGKANDTNVMLNSLAYKMSSYERLGMTDSVIAIGNFLYDSIYVCNEQREVARFFCAPIKSYLIKGDTAKASMLLKVYEQESGYFDSDNNIERGREAYYFLKGKYFLSIGMMDSAEFFFRKELNQGGDIANQNMASRALSLLFDNRQIADSAAKYALYSYAMNDSAYRRMTTQEMEHVKGMYDYSRYERLAYKEKLKAERYHRHIILLMALFVNAILICFMTWYWQRRKREEERKSYLQVLRSLNKTKIELKGLKDHETILGDQIVEKEKEIEELRAEFELYKSKQPDLDEDMEIAKMLIEDEAIFKKLKKKADIGKKLTEEEWKELNDLSSRLLLKFHECITARSYSLNVQEQRLCILLRLNVKPKAASNLLDVSPSLVTKLSKSILMRIFKVDGITKDLVERLKKLC